MSGAPAALSALAARAIWPGEDTFGISTASGPAAATAFMSASPHGVSRPLMRATTSRPPKPPARDRLRHLRRARLLGVGCDSVLEVENHASAGKLRAFSSARAFEPGM